MTDEKQLSPEQDTKLKLFLLKFSRCVEMWAKAHSKDGLNSSPPVYWNEGIRDFIWMNRAERRKK